MAHMTYPASTHSERTAGSDEAGGATYTPIEL